MENILKVRLVNVIRKLVFTMWVVQDERGGGGRSEVHHGRGDTALNTKYDQTPAA